MALPIEKSWMMEITGFFSWCCGTWKFYLFNVWQYNLYHCPEEQTLKHTLISEWLLVRKKCLWLILQIKVLDKDVWRISFYRGTQIQLSQKKKKIEDDTRSFSYMKVANKTCKGLINACSLNILESTFIVFQQLWMGSDKFL